MQFRPEFAGFFSTLTDRINPVRLFAFSLAATLISGCTVSEFSAGKNASAKPDYINNETKFTSADFGVESSPRVTTEKRPRKGGGRYQIGKPYKIRGKWYKPTEDQPGQQTGMASWYGPNFHGRLTANGEIYDQFSLSAAHPTMPLPSYAKVTNLENGRSVMVRVNDRGPYSHGRIIDLSARAAKMLGYDQQGVAKVKVEYAGKAQMDGLDEKMLIASFADPTRGNDGSPFGNAAGTMLAMVGKPDLPSQGTPGAAINQSFTAGDYRNLASVPVPEVRPTLFDGIPLMDGSTVVYSAVPRPLAYAGEVDYSYASHPMEGRGYLGERPNQEIAIEIGRLAHSHDVIRLDGLLGDAASLENREGIIVAITRESEANRMLDYLQSIGFKTAAIR